MANWSKWTDINEKLPSYEGPGVYKIRLADLKGQVIVIGRFHDNDKNGILMIGSSNNIKRRLQQFRGAINGNKYGHAEAIRFYLILKYTKFKKEQYKLQYSFKKLNKNNYKEEEERLIKCYFKKYGEVPPLNNNLPSKHVDWNSLRC